MAAIIGLAGTFASGKDTVAEYIASKHGYVHVSTGDIVRAESLKRGLSTHRNDLFNVANNMRATQGADTLVENALKQDANRQEKLVISGIRNVKEVETLKASGGLFVFVDAPVESRFERAKARGRLEDKTDLAGFKAQEERELINTEEHAQHISALKGLADVTIVNDGSLADLQTKVDKLVRNEWTKGPVTHTWGHWWQR